MTANDKDPLFRQTLRKMREDASHPLYRSLRDRTDPDYKMSMRAFRLLNRLAEGVTPEPDLPPLREDEIVQAAFRKDHFEAVGNKNHPLNPASFEMAGTARKETAREEMRHVMALGYRDSFPADAVTRAQEYFQGGFPKRIKQKMETYRKAVSPLLDQPQTATQARPSNQAQAKRAEPLYASLPPANQSVRSDAEAPRPLSSYRSVGEALFASIQGSQANDAIGNTSTANPYANPRPLGSQPRSPYSSGNMMEINPPKGYYEERSAAINRIFQRADDYRKQPKALEKQKKTGRRQSFSNEDTEDQDPTDLSDFYNRISYLLPDSSPVEREAFLNLFFNEGGAKQDGTAAKFGITQKVLDEVGEEFPDLDLPKNVSGLDADDAVYIMDYFFKRNLSSLSGRKGRPLTAIERIKDDKLRNAYADTIYRHGAGAGEKGGSSAILRAVNQTLANLEPEERKAIGFGDSVDHSRVKTRGTTDRQGTFNAYVALANSKHAPLLRQYLAEERNKIADESSPRQDSFR